MNTTHRESVLTCKAICALTATMVLIAGDVRPGAQYASQFPSYLRPIAPLFPETMAACDALAAKWNELCGAIGKAHAECLASTKAEGLNPGGTCSKAACQPLHGACGQFGDENTRAVDTCRVQVREKQRLHEETVERTRPKPSDRAVRNPPAANAPARPGGDQRRARQHQRLPRAEIRGELAPAGAGEIVQALIEEGLDDGIHRLDANIVEAAQRLTGSRSREYLRDAADTRAVLRGMKRMMTTAEYASLVGQLLGARESASRTRAAAEIGLQVFTDIGSKGLEFAADRVFGRRIAAVLTGPVAWVAVEALTPTPTSRDFSEIIRDTSGRTTVEEKQFALFRLWQAYDQFGSHWHAGQKRELLEATDIVYRLR